MRSRRVCIVEALALGVFTLLILALACHLGRAPVLTLLPGLLLGYLSADIASGLVHWVCDNFFEEDSPVIGPLFIHPFREHHRDPEGMTRHGFLELTGNSCLAMIPLLSFVWWRRDSMSALSQATVVFLCLALFATNLFHKWAHAKRVPPLIRTLQQYRLILTPAHHRRHHDHGFSGAYCITSGWMSRSLDFLLGSL
jgi:hypothetical protein